MPGDYSEIRPETQNMIENPETVSVEYKQNLNHVQQRELVAFANARGGTILIGVKQESDASGRQYGVIVGFPGDYDRTRGAIQSRANECHPPIEVDISREYDGMNFIYRIDISEASEKPCCTGGGSYSIRLEGEIKPILPTQMKMMIIEREVNEFARRLEEAGTRFIETLKIGQEALSDQLDGVDQVANSTLYAAKLAQEAAFEAGGAAQEAMLFADEASGSLDEVRRILEGLEVVLYRIQESLTKINTT